MSYTNVTRLGHAHTEWLRSLEFYKEEMKIFKTRLTEVAGKNTSFEARQGMEHFENQFTVQRENIDELNHEIGLYTSKIAEESSEHAGHVEEELVTEHDLLKEKVEGFEKTFNELRHEFNEYLSKWM